MERMRADPPGDLVPCVGDRNKIHNDDREGHAQLKSAPVLGFQVQRPKNFAPVPLVPTKPQRKSFTEAPVYPVNELPGWSVLQNK